MQTDILNDENLVKVLKNGGVAIIPTDTIYGIIGQAENSNSVLRIYEIRKRNQKKHCIILIGDLEEIKKFNIVFTEAQKNQIKNFNEQTSFILDCPDDKFFYLHRGTKTLAFRVPYSQELRNLLFKTGPLIAPSANLEGFPPAQTISEAKEYFGNLVDLYIDGGKLSGKASKVIKLHKDGSVKVLRP